jgi:predicted oxidoreductase
VNHASERLFGQALALEPSLRSKMELITKCGIVCPSPETGVRVKHYDLSEEYILKRVQESLEALGVEYVDVLLIHRPSPLMNAQVVTNAFKLLKSQGKVKYFGVSNFTPHQFNLLQSCMAKEGMGLVTNQIEFHPLHLSPLHDGTLDQAQELQLSPMIWSPLAGGRLVKPLANKDQVPDGDRISRVQLALKKLSVAEGASIDQVIGIFLMSLLSKENLNICE